MEPVIDYRELLQRLEAMGLKVSVDQKQGLWEARGKAKKGSPVTRIGNSPEWAVLSLYNAVLNRNMMRSMAASVQKRSAWDTPWHNMSEQIGKAYAQAPAYDTNAEAYWTALANETQKQADAGRNQVRVEETSNPDPYLNVKDMLNDIHKNQHLLMSTHDLKHPIWSRDQHMNFKIAHAIAGHGASGGDHTWLGRNLAVSHHMPLLTPPAREALFSERIARPAYHQHYDGNGPHKVALFSEFLNPVAEDNGEHLHVPHGGMDVIHMGSHLEEFNLIDPLSRSVFLPFDQPLTSA